MPNPLFDRLVSARDWVEVGGGGALFPTIGSWNKFAKNNREELIARRALFLGAGRAPNLIDPEVVMDVAIEIRMRQTDAAA